MRGVWLVALLLLALGMSGCLADRDGDGQADGMSGSQTDGANQAVGTDAAGNTVREGDDLGTLTFDESGDAGVQGYSSRCDDPLAGQSQTQVGILGGTGDHQWVIPSKNADGIPWVVKSLTLDLSQEIRTSTDLDLFVYDSNGNLLGRTFEEGPDPQEAVNSITFYGVQPGKMNLEVVNCGGDGTEYSLVGSAAMIAASSTHQPSGACTATPTSNGYEAKREQTFTTTLSGSTGTADISTGAGYIAYETSSGDDYQLVATFRAKGSTAEQACERLAEMYLEHEAIDGAAVVLNVHGKPGGNNQWSNKQIDLDFEAPSGIDWSTYKAVAGAGAVTVQGVTATSMDINAGAGLAWVSDATAGTLKVHSGAGASSVDDSEADELNVYAGAGSVTVTGTRGNDVKLHSGAGQVVAAMEASTASGSWDVDAGAGQIDLTVEEPSSIGYDVDARTGAGQVTFNFKNVEQTSSDCQYASCHRQGKTTNYDSKSIKVSLDLDVGAGQITVGS